MAMREEEEEELIRRTSSSGSTDMMQDFSNMRTSSVPDVDVLSTMHPDTKWHQARRSKGDAEDFAKMFKTMIADEKNIFGHGLTAGDVKVLAALAHTLILKPGEIFCAEGEQAEHLVVIIEGVVSVITLRRVFASLGPGRFIGEIGLVKGFHIRSATIRAETTCKLAVLPYKKFLRFLKSLGEEKESALLSFCVNALVPRYHALDFFKLKHRSATLIQSNFRSHIAQQLLKQKKSRVLLRSAQRIQKLFRHYKEHVLEKTAFQTPFVETLQKAYRSHHARREFRRIRRMRREGYGARHERAAGIIQRTFRLKILKKAARKHGHLTKMGSLLEDLDEEQKQRTTNTFQSLVHRGDTLNVFQKWKRVLIVRSFNSWQTLVRATARQIVKARLAAQSLVYGSLFSCLHRWRERATNITVVAPWRGRVGKLVELSTEGKEYEYALGKRVEGDSGCGILLHKVVADGSMWRVRWLSSGLHGNYFTGSCGRYHLLWWKEQREEEDKVARKVNWVTSFHKALALLLAALRRDKGIKAVGRVTPAAGGIVQLPCPLGSTWMITADFPPRAVLQSCEVQVAAIEAADFEAQRCEKGYICSPMVQVLPRDGVFVLDKAFRLSFPHRAANTPHLAVYFWHDVRGDGDKVLGAVLTETSCTVTVERFGLYGVVNAAVATPEVVYGALEVPNARDSSGRFLSQVSLGTPFKAKVLLIPRACARAAHRVWALLPTFHLAHGAMLEKVAVHPEYRLEGCTFNSWSARHTYSGQLLSLSFHTIIQIAAGQSADHSHSFPVSNLHVSLLDQELFPVVRFAGQPEFLVKIVALQLPVGMEMPDGSAHSTFVCTLHGRETMATVRRWLAKCWFTAEASWEDLRWFCRLRYQKGQGDARPYMTLAEEVLEPATQHLSGAHLALVPEPIAHRYGTQAEVNHMMGDLGKYLQLAPPAAPPPPLNRAHPLSSHPSRVASAQPSRLSSAPPARPPILGRPETTAYPALLASLQRRRSGVSAARSSHSDFLRRKSVVSEDSLFGGWAEPDPDLPPPPPRSLSRPPAPKPSPKTAGLWRVRRSMEQHGPLAAAAAPLPLYPHTPRSPHSAPALPSPPATQREEEGERGGGGAEEQQQRMRVLSGLSPLQLRVLHDRAAHHLRRLAHHAAARLRVEPGAGWEEREEQRRAAVSRALLAALDPPRPPALPPGPAHRSGLLTGTLRPSTAGASMREARGGQGGAAKTAPLHPRPSQ